VSERNTYCCKQHHSATLSHLLIFLTWREFRYIFNSRDKLGSADSVLNCRFFFQINIVNERKESALHLAAKGGYLEAVKELVERGANILFSFFQVEFCILSCD
jgi:ankyrin repeat protein